MMTNNFKYLGAAALVLCTSLGMVSACAAANAYRPNILIILSDDVGYTDTGCYGAIKLKTPNIDRIAAEGMRFTNAHSPAAVCSPTRYGLITGEYPFRNPHFDQGVLKFTSRLGIDVKQPTIASFARSQGYATGVVGKWHMGLGAQDCPDYNTAVKPGPLELGFDECYIAPGNLRDRLYLENHHVVGLDPDDPLVYNPDPKRPKGKILRGARRPAWHKSPTSPRVSRRRRSISLTERRTNHSFSISRRTMCMYPLCRGRTLREKATAGPMATTSWNSTGWWEKCS